MEISDGGGAVEQVRVRVLPDGRMTRDDAARYLGHSPKTLAQWQVYGKGPRSVRVAGRVFYYRDDLDTFIRGGAAA
jgi:hypothetical protein